MIMQRFTLALLLVLTGLLAPGLAWAVIPTVTVSSPTSPIATSPITFVITFDQPVTGLVAGELTVVNGTLLSLQQVTSGTYSAQWVASVSPTSEGNVSLAVVISAASNAAAESSQASNTCVVVYDTPPVATVTVPVASLSGVTFSIHFNQAWSISDISKLAVTGASISTQGLVSATPYNTYDVQVVPYGNGTVSIQVGAGTFIDSGTLTNAATSGSVTVGAASTGTEAHVTSLQFTSPANRSYATGDAVNLDVIFSRPVTVMGLPIGAPALALNATGSAGITSSAAYVSTSGTHLSLRFTVLAGHYSSALDALSSNALTLGNGGGIVGDDSYLALLTLPAPGSSTSLRGSGVIGINYQPPKDPVDAVAGKSTTNACGLGSGVGVMLTGLLAGLALARRRR